MMKLKNTNVTSLLYTCVERKEAIPIVKILSKTNYIYTPFIHSSSDDAREIVQNLLDGKIKNEIYKEFYPIFVRIGVVKK